MKLKALLTSASLLALAASPVMAGAPSTGTVSSYTAPADTDLGVTATLGYDTDFVFRGLNYANHWVSGGVSLDIPLVDTVSFVAGASYGVSADDNVVLGGINQIFPGLSYERLELNGGIAVDLGAAELGVGYRFYNHQGDLSAALDDGHEVGITIATSAGPLNVGLGGYYDFGIEGWYFEAAVNSEIVINDTISLVPGASIGYAQDYSWHVAGFDRSGFTAVNLSLAMPIKLTSHATLTPYVAGLLPIDTLDAAGEDAIVYGGIRLSVSF